MDIKKYIESGILENYVLGLCTQAERAEVQAYMIQHSAIRQEVEAIELALETYADAHQAQAPAHLEAKILERINGGSNNTSSQKSNSGWLRNLLWLLLLGSLIVGLIWYYLQHRQKTTELEKTQQELIDLKSDCDEKDETIRSLEEKIKILRESGNIKIEMKGLPEKAPDAVANVIYNPINKKSYLDILQLPTPPADKQYQLWAIVDGQPVDMGVFDMTTDLDTILQEVPFIEQPQAFAVTLEKLGGNPTPTLEEMVVIGNFSG